MVNNKMDTVIVNEWNLALKIAKRNSLKLECFNTGYFEISKINPIKNNLAIIYKHISIGSILAFLQGFEYLNKEKEL